MVMPGKRAQSNIFITRKAAGAAAGSNRTIATSANKQNAAIRPAITAEAAAGKRKRVQNEDDDEEVAPPRGKARKLP